MEFSNESSLRTQGPQRERKALIAAARTLASALEQRPFLTSEARGYGSLRPQGRPAERLYEATTASTYGSIQSYAIALLPVAAKPYALRQTRRESIWSRVRRLSKVRHDNGRCQPVSSSGNSEDGVQRSGRDS